MRFREEMPKHWQRDMLCYVVVPGAVKWGAVGVSEQTQTQAFMLWGGSDMEH